MNAKGVTFLARQALVVEEKGPQVWQKYFDELVKVEPFFKQPVLPITQIPINTLLKSLDLLVATVYARDPKAWWHFGVMAGKHALTKGQLRGLFQRGEGRKLLAFGPKVLTGMFDFGALTVHDVDPTTVELRITGFPLHPYFEGTSMGFASGGLELLGAKNPIPKMISGFATRSKEVVYRFHDL
ncbi:MAG: hypothetical protein IPJ65_43605 [Archangiaceae bacterium]|nr:hypothetical protein [Archangiaceae bacterium]